MRKIVVIVVTTLIFVLLIFRQIRQHSNRLQNEREWYLQNLKFAFSAEVDSVTVDHMGNGLLYFHITSGGVDPGIEERLKGGLKHHTVLFLLGTTPSGTMEMATEHARDFLQGDSIVVTSGKDEIVNYRGGERLRAYGLLRSLRGGEF